MTITIYDFREVLTQRVVYVGQTSDLENRLNIGYQGCKKFYKAISKYMTAFNISEKEVLEKYFKREILATLSDKTSADIMEEYYIEKYKTLKDGYNTIPGGSKTYSEIINNKEVSSIKDLNKLKNNLVKQTNSSDKSLTVKLIRKNCKRSGLTHSYKSINTFLKTVRANNIDRIIEAYNKAISSNKSQFVVNCGNREYQIKINK